MQRDKKNNDDQNMQTPLHNNYIEDNQEYEDVDEYLDIHLFKDDISISNLTHNEYEYSLNSQAGESTIKYQMISDYMKG
jgi:hypothetical protein